MSNLNLKITPTVCPDCLGDFPVISECCGAPIDTDILICSDCKEHSDLAVCETCNGTGQKLGEQLT